MKKLVEFGYPVSKDYEKLWEILNINGKIGVLFGFIDTAIDGEMERTPAYINSSDDNDEIQITPEWEDDDKIEQNFILSYFYDEPEKHEVFIADCLRINLTFIDPEPENPNAIYYSDGSVVDCDCDIINTDGIKAFEGKIGKKIEMSFIHLERGTIYVCHKFIDGQIFTVTANRCHGIKWKRNVMTNVSKVVK